MRTKNFLAIASLALAMMANVNLNAQDYSDCGCPPVASRTEVNTSTLVDAAGNLLSGNTVLTCDKLYKLNSRMYVLNGQTLTIQAGTVVKGLPNDTANAVIVTRGGKIYASGTESCPIIFTANDDPLDGTYGVTNQGKWGGLIILGRAYNNVLGTDVHSYGAPIGKGNGLGTIEGLYDPDPRHWYGADLTGAQGSIETFNDDDNSGILEYVSIRHGGAVIGEANEINGLTLGSVGRGTTLRHIEVISNQDDGVEFFGGTVDLKYANVLFCDDDYIDYDQGYKGRVQFVLGVQRNGLDAGTYKDDNGIEGDGDDGSVSGRTANSTPKLYNFTMVGRGRDQGMEAKERTSGLLANSIFYRFSNMINVTAAGTPPMQYYSNTALHCGAISNVSVDASNISSDTTTLGVNLSIKVNTNGTVSGAIQPVPSGNVGNTYAVPIDGFFTPASYRGAFEPGKEPWTAGWTYQTQHEGFDISVIECDGDISGDRKVNFSDLSVIINNYNSNCNIE